MKSLMKEEFIQHPSQIGEDDRLIQLFQNERFDQYALFDTGRLFKKRARGQSGSYDDWQEIDLKAEINNDLSLK